MIDELREFTGETAEAAIASASGHFGVPETQLDVKVVPRSLGVSGLGNRFLILATVREAPQKTGPVSDFVQAVLQHLNATARLKLHEDERDGTILIQLEGPRVAELSEQDPNFLPALSHIADRAAARLIGVDAKAEVQISAPRPSGGGGGGDGRGRSRDRDRGGDRGGRGGRGGRERGGDRGGSGRRDERGGRGGRGGDRGRPEARNGRSSGLDDQEREAVEQYAREAAEEVVRTGEPKILRDMNSRERWVVHNTVRDIEGVRSESIGEDPSKRVKLLPE
jgi:predicted RNA-binding protein Jag